MTEKTRITSLTDPALRDHLAQIIWEAGPGNEWHVVMPWEEWRDEEISRGNEQFIYAQADAVQVAISDLFSEQPVAITSAMVEAARAKEEELVQNMPLRRGECFVHMNAYDMRQVLEAALAAKEQG